MCVMCIYNLQCSLYVWHCIVYKRDTIRVSSYKITMEIKSRSSISTITIVHMIILSFSRSLFHSFSLYLSVYASFCLSLFISLCVSLSSLQYCLVKVTKWHNNSLLLELISSKQNHSLCICVNSFVYLCKQPCVFV